MQVQSRSHYLSVLNDFTRKNKKFDTNCYYSLERVDDLILNDKLYYELSDTQLLLFQKDNNYYILYYYVSKEAKLNISSNTTLLVELIGNAKTYDSRREKELQDNGFILHDKNLQIVRKKEQMEEFINKYSFAVQYVQNNGFSIEYARLNDIDELYALWRKYINNYAIKEMTISEQREMAEKNRCAVIRNSQKELSATYMYSIERKVALLSHAVVIPQYRMKGFLPAVRCICMENAINEGIEKSISWIAVSNKASMRAAGSHIKSGKFSQQLIKFQEENKK